MGVCMSGQSEQSQNIQKQLKKDYTKESESVKLLLLGPGESGKSTILKQMRILHMNGFDTSQLLEYRMIIFTNIVSSMAEILNAMNAIIEPSDTKPEQKERQTVLEFYAKNSVVIQMNESLYNSIKTLWKDEGVKGCFERRDEYNLIDSAKYFFDNLDRICDSEYIPTVQDTLMARAATTGIVEVMFTNKDGAIFRVFDVGGQKSERRKWIHCFDQVNAVIFIVAVSEYDKMMREDQTTNRMTDSCDLFSEICNSHWFIKADMILFLNKRDLFEEKIKTVSIKCAFPNFGGPSTYEACIDYIIDQFINLNNNPGKKVTAHVTCATDTGQVEIVINEVIQGIITKNMASSGVV